MREMDRLCAKSWWAFFECDKARFGTAGTSMLELLLDGRIPITVFERWGASKKLSALLGSETGDASTEDVSGVVAAESIKFREMVVKSESLPELMDEFDDDIELSELISG